MPLAHLLVFRRSGVVAAALALVLAACTTGLPSPSPSGTGQPTAGSPGATPTPTAEATPRPVAWTQLEADGPAAREDHTWTAATDGTAYLFGGRDGRTVFDDLWAYDPAANAWEQLAPEGRTPAARFGHNAAWVEGVGVVIFAGQANATTFFDDLWAYDPAANAWEPLPAPEVSPVARYGSCAALGPDGRLWISHGFTSDGTRFADTWVYDFSGGAWTEQTPLADRPVVRCLHGCWWTTEASQPQFVLYAGQTTGITAIGDLWALEIGERPGTNAWAQHTGTLPPHRNLYAAARVDGATLVFGGQGVDGGYLGDAWLIDDQTLSATPLEVAGEPPAGRAGAELIADPERGRLLLFGGRDRDGAFADLWELTLPAT